ATLEPFDEREGLGRLVGVRALVGLERRMVVGVERGAVEQAQDLGHVVLMHAEGVEPAHVLVAERFGLLGREPELARDPLEVRVPALAQPRVATDIEHHLVERQRLVGALGVAHYLSTLGLHLRNMITQRSDWRFRTSWGTLAGNLMMAPAGTAYSSPPTLMLAVPSSTKIASSSFGW